MENPFMHLLPSAMQFSALEGIRFVLLLGLLLFCGSAGGRAFQKLHVPQVVGYIVVGIILGVSGLYVLGPQMVAALNPVSSIALSLIGFLVGTELKIEVVRKYGKQFMGILLGESLTPFVIVGALTGLATFVFTRDVKTAVAMGLVLGAICSATAPAATTDVLKEYRSRGPLTTTTLGIVALDDAVALILYAVAASIASPLLGGKSLSFFSQLLVIAYDIFGSILVGLVCGWMLSMILRRMMDDEGRVLGFSLGMLFLCTGVAELLDVDTILASMTVGFFMVNAALPKTRRMFRIVERFTPPVYVLFFVLVGAKLNIWIITPFFAVVAVLYVAGRTVGKTLGSRLGAILTKAPETVRRYLPFCLLSQAGVAIGLSIAAGTEFPDSIGPQIMLIITATTFIVQLIGPVCVKYGIQHAGEVGLNVTAEDIRKKTRVVDITVRGVPVCSAESCTIVNELDKIGDILELFTRHENVNYEVRDSSGRLSGQISLTHLKEALQIGKFAEFMLAMDIMEKPRAQCLPDALLPDVYQLFEDYDTEAIAIVDEFSRPMGVLEKQTVDHYIHTKIIEVEHKIESLGQS